MQEHTSARRMAEDAIALALNRLQPDGALAALTEIIAMILAGAGFVPRTPEFEDFVTRLRGDNQDERAASIWMRMRRGWTDGVRA